MEFSDVAFRSFRQVQPEVKIVGAHNDSQVWIEKSIHTLECNEAPWEKQRPMEW